MKKTKEPLMTQDSTVAELLDLTHRMLQSITDGDWKTYASLCDPIISLSSAMRRPASRGFSERISMVPRERLCEMLI